MNLSKTANDPFRFLKRTRTTTPQKKLALPVQGRHDVSIQPILPLSIASSCVSAPKDIPRQNHYDPEKYYSSKCEDYLELINFSRARAAAPLAKTKASQSIDFLQEVVKTEEKRQLQRFPLEEVHKELTFKKIEQKVEDKQTEPTAQRQMGSFRVEDYEISDQVSSGEKKECGSCGRLFILASYEKHVKVCEQVFCKKRKPFSSEKQRSLSKEKRPQARRQ